MNINTITDAFVFLRQDGSASQPLTDAMNAYAISKAKLEDLFYKWCWSAEGSTPYEGDDLAYSIELGHIEEFLVHQGLIYSVD